MLIAYSGADGFGTGDVVPVSSQASFAPAPQPHRGTIMFPPSQTQHLVGGGRILAQPGARTAQAQPSTGLVLFQPTVTPTPSTTGPMITFPSGNVSFMPGGAAQPAPGFWAGLTSLGKAAVVGLPLLALVGIVYVSTQKKSGTMTPNRRRGRYTQNAPSSPISHIENDMVVMPKYAKKGARIVSGPYHHDETDTESWQVLDVQGRVRGEYSAAHLKQKFRRVGGSSLAKAMRKTGSSYLATRRA